MSIPKERDEGKKVLRESDDSEGRVKESPEKFSQKVKNEGVNKSGRRNKRAQGTGAVWRELYSLENGGSGFTRVFRSKM